MPKKEIKKEIKKPSRAEAKKEIPAKAARYVEAVGRRKTAIARVRIFGGHGGFMINGKDLGHYFSLERLRLTAAAPFKELKAAGKFDVDVRVAGGGIRAQADAIRLGISRALVAQNGEFKKRLRRAGFLTRDSRKVERKKYGLKKARRAPQWQKR